jgi:hypothetical protein
MSLTESAANSAFLPSASRLLYRDDDVPGTDAAQRDVDVLRLYAGSLQSVPRAIRPRHVDRGRQRAWHRHPGQVLHLTTSDMACWPRAAKIAKAREMRGS